MYESFFDLNKKPFTVLPDSRYLYPASAHRSALGLLEYSIRCEAPFIVLIGDPGTGKTSLLQKFASEYSDQHVIRMVSTVGYESTQLLPWILLSLELSEKQLDPIESFYRLSKFVEETCVQDRRLILVIDEAQTLGPKQLEELRLLSNLNSESALKIQMILAGHPDLIAILKRKGLRQFAQRIALDVLQLKPLASEETVKYIQHRLKMAGSECEVFTMSARELIHRISEGNPRLINQVCDMALTEAFEEQARVVTKEIVLQATRKRYKAWLLPLASPEENETGEADNSDDDIETKNSPEDPHQVGAQTHPLRLVQEPDSLSHARNHYADGVQLKSSRQFDRAIEMFHLAAQAPPLLIKARAQAGLCYWMKADYRPAVEEFRQALRGSFASEGSRKQVLYFLARTLEQTGQLDEAVTEYQCLMGEYPSYKDVPERLKKLTKTTKTNVDSSEGTQIFRSRWVKTAIKTVNSALWARG